MDLGIGSTPNRRAEAILGRLDRLPATRHVWSLVVLLSLGGMFEFYDLFMTGYVVPGLVKAGLLAGVGLAIFAAPRCSWPPRSSACSSARSCSASSPTGTAAAPSSPSRCCGTARPR